MSTIYFLLLVGLNICLIAILFSLYMLYRNDKVYEYHMNLLHNNPNQYENLADYREMMAKWWEWDFTKFIKEGEEYVG